MIFGTYWFVAFCCVFFPIYWLAGVSRGCRQAWLLLACFTFHYHFAGPAGVLPIICLSLLTFAAALTQRAAVIIVAIICDVSALAFYKYFHFATLQVVSLAAPATGASLERYGNALLPGAPPLAISFFVFELVHYLYDVKQGHAPMRSLAQYASFIFFFPSLVAGPIKRYETFLPELHLGLGQVTTRQVTTGLMRIARGYFLKIAVADFFTGFIDYYEPIFDQQRHPLQYAIFLSLGLRIWFDFSGYSEIAIGLALLMGIKLPENFNWPYAATNVRDFWHRWHISLSSWVRDYIYIPMGGSRVGLGRTVLNGVVAFALCGLWHGPAWHFVFWGLYHGLGLALSSHYPRMFGALGRVLHRFLAANPLVGWLVTFYFVMAGWAYFFYPVREAEHMLKHLFPLKYTIPGLMVGTALAVGVRKLSELLQKNGWNFHVPELPAVGFRPFALGLVAAFLGCCWAGTYPQTHNIYRDFHRFHEEINPQSAYYPTASQVKALAEATLPRDKIIVVLGGNSTFLGLRQNISEVWTIELGKLLGDRFAIFNLGLPNGTASGEGATAFEMLAGTYPKLIYAFSELPLGNGILDGDSPYHYFFWDAYYKGLLHPDPERQREIRALRREELKTVPGQELHVGAFLDSFTNADDLWTWVTYRWVATIWSDKTASSPFRARRDYSDETKNTEFPSSDPYRNLQNQKPVNVKFRGMVNFEHGRPEANTIWKQQMRSVVGNVPAPLRSRTIACMHWLCPWTAEALTPDQIQAQSFCYDSVLKTYHDAGYVTMQFGNGFDGWEYADGSHLDATGGRHLAHELAPVILDVARTHNY